MAADDLRFPQAHADDASFVGKEVCIGCHAKEAQLWRGSRHDQAMQEASDRTVLGDVNDVTQTHFGVTSTFFRRVGKFFVWTDGPDGELHDYQIAYTFGVYPLLQQYLVGFPGGRYPTLPLAWDARHRRCRCLGRRGVRWQPTFCHVAFNDFRIVRDNLAGRRRSACSRLVPCCMFTNAAARPHRPERN